MRPFESGHGHINILTKQTKTRNDEIEKINNKIRLILFSLFSRFLLLFFASLFFFSQELGERFEIQQQQQQTRGNNNTFKKKKTKTFLFFAYYFCDYYGIITIYYK